MTQKFKLISSFALILLIALAALFAGPISSTSAVSPQKVAEVICDSTIQKTGSTSVDDARVQECAVPIYEDGINSSELSEYCTILNTDNDTGFQLTCTSETQVDVSGFNGRYDDITDAACQIVNDGARQSCIDRIYRDGPNESDIEKFCAASTSEATEYLNCINRDYSDFGVSPDFDPNPPEVVLYEREDENGNPIVGEGPQVDVFDVCKNQGKVAQDDGRCEESTCDLQNEDSGACEIFDTIGTIVNGMTLLVIPVVIIAVIVGGIQYSMSSGNPSGTQAAKDRIYKAMFALFCFIFLWAFLQWLIPGGIV